MTELAVKANVEAAGDTSARTAHDEREALDAAVRHETMEEQTELPSACAGLFDWVSPATPSLHVQVGDDDRRRTEFASRGPYHLWDKVFVPRWPPLLLTDVGGGQSGAWADGDDIFGNAARFPGELNNHWLTSQAVRLAVPRWYAGSASRMWSRVTLALSGFNNNLAEGGPRLTVRLAVFTTAAAFDAATSGRAAADQQQQQQRASQWLYVEVHTFRLEDRVYSWNMPPGIFAGGDEQLLGGANNSGSSGGGSGSGGSSGGDNLVYWLAFQACNSGNDHAYQFGSLDFFSLTFADTFPPTTAAPRSVVPHGGGAANSSAAYGQVLPPEMVAGFADDGTDGAICVGQEPLPEPSVLAKSSTKFWASTPAAAPPRNTHRLSDDGDSIRPEAVKSTALTPQEALDAAVVRSLASNDPDGLSVPASPSSSDGAGPRPVWFEFALRKPAPVHASHAAVVLPTSNSSGSRVAMQALVKLAKKYANGSVH